jgi:cytochrome c-type biogenesis protein CcmH
MKIAVAGDMRLALTLALVVASLVSAVVQAQDPQMAVDTQAQRMYSALMSPYCPGLLLADCPSQDAFTLRAEIRARLAKGETPADIERDLYGRFGDRIRAVPAAQGWGLLLRVAPLLLFALSLAGLAWYLSRVRTRDDGPLPPAARGDRVLEERLDDELANAE